MVLMLYELAGLDDRRFSPYCWRTRMALAHKRLDYETVPVRFTDKPMIAFSGQERVPVIRDGETVVSDSWAIAQHLERGATRPDDHGGPQFGDGDRAGCEDLADFVSAGEMIGQPVRVFVAEPTEIHDP